MRDSGFSYNMISLRLDISKSTLSNWFKDRPFTPNQTVIKRIKYGPMKSAEIRHNRRVKEIEDLRAAGMHEIGIIAKRDLWLLGIGLYIGEGAKTHETIRVINADPSVIRLAIKWFKEICDLTTHNITIAIHLYPDNDIKQSLRFWSRTTQIPIRNFGKTQIDRRKNKSKLKKRKLPYGTAHVTIVSRNDPTKGVRLHRRISGWIAGVLSQA